MDHQLTWEEVKLYLKQQTDLLQNLLPIAPDGKKTLIPIFSPI